MPNSIGIAGAGVIGRLLALELAHKGHKVTLFDKGTPEGRDSCSWTGAGMLAPFCELETAEPEIAALGQISMKRWPDILAALPQPVYYRQLGSIVVAHPADRDELNRLFQCLESKSSDREAIQQIDRDTLAQLEPALATRFHRALFTKYEGQLDNRELLSALALALDLAKVHSHYITPITHIKPHEITTPTGKQTFDFAIDCRGLGAMDDLKNLRGVRGELIYVKALEIELQRPVRLMHPRYPLYIVPRANHVYVIGATKIESDSLDPITVRSALELLTAAYTVHTGFAEANIIDTSVHCRPAFPDNRPRILSEPGLMRINGCYRHGFLVAPGLVDMALHIIAQEKSPETSPYFVEMKS